MERLLGGGDTTQLEFRHHWLLIELLDQMTRVQSGGEMLKCFRDIQHTCDSKRAQYIKMRVGDDLLAPHQSPHIPLRRKITLDKIANKILSLYLKFLRFCVPRGLRDEVFIATSIGERHKWMYDRFSLPKLLQEVGFIHAQVLDYQSSAIEGFSAYYLDSNPDNTPYKGASSLYVESKKPS
ncbi:methyltransferase type 11 [uncultured Helicobacter sp.]|uniref:methyltransferase type 11 n=1 Tax=uncultured Helicobacter sp. TaxID=175537 RepID=UPI00374FE8EF